MNDIILKNIDLDKNFDSGQVFRWYRANDGYIAVIGGSLYLFEDLSDFKVKASLISGTPLDIKRYFDNDRNYDKINTSIIKEHKRLQKVVDYGKGIRILRQDPLEMIITFILSANNNINRIRNSVEAISKAKGKYVADYDGISYYSFPSLSALKELSEIDFKNFGAGYRANYLYETISRLSLEDVDYMKKLDTDALIDALKRYKGVGQKVAECIALFGYGRFDVFPIDTWMKKALSHFYGLEGYKDKELAFKVRELFSDNRALVQQYMFFYMREDGKND